MSKKLLSVLLALALLVSSFAISAFAGMGDDIFETDEDAVKYTQEWALGEPKDIGDGKYTVDVTLKANYLVGPMQFKVIKKVTAGTLTLTDAVESANIPENWIANVSFKDATGEVVIIPEPTEYAVNALDCSAGVVVATLTYTASSDAAATLTIDVADAKGPKNPDGTLIAARMEDGNVVTDTAITGQTVSQTTNTVTIGNAVVATPELVGKAFTFKETETTGYVDDENGFVYGVLEGADPLNYFEATNGGYIEMSENAQNVTNGTGSVLTLYKDNTKSEVIDTWELVIFGDVNGDGAVDIADPGPIMLFSVGSGDLTGAYLFAADTDKNGDVDIGDPGPIMLHAVGSSSITPYPYA